MRAMTTGEAREFIGHNKTCVLALANGSRSYALPLYYGYDGRYLYFHTHPGAKSAFIANTREACLAIVRCVSLDDWASVMVFGRIERTDDGPGELAAMNALMSVPLPPEWGESLPHEPKRGAQRVATYRLVPTLVTGRFSASPALATPEGAV